MIIYIYGEDTFRSREYLREVVEQFKKQRDPQGYNVVFLDGKKEELGRILGELKTAPFLSERRMVIIEDVLSKSDKEFLEGLVTLVEKKGLPESNVAVFYQADDLSKVKEVKKLHEILAKEKFAREFKKLNEVESVIWLEEEIKKRGGKISRLASRYLSENLGGDMWLGSSLARQLASYKKGEEIIQKDVQLFLEEKAADNIFEMSEAVAGGNRKLAFRLVEDQRRLGEDDGYLFSMILRQFKILLQIRDMFEREDNLPSDEMAKILGLHPYVVKKSLPLVKRYSLARLKEIYGELLEIDIKTKTGRGGQSFLIDLFIGRN